MRMYLVHAPNNDSSEAGFAKFVATSAEAASERKRLNNEEGIPRSKMSTDEVDVPTAKAELITFLNVMLSAPKDGNASDIAAAAPKKD